MVFAYFPVLISVGYTFLVGCFVSVSQLNHPLMFITRLTFVCRSYLDDVWQMVLHHPQTVVCGGFW